MAKIISKWIVDLHVSGKTKHLQCNVGKHFHDLGQTLNETQKCSLLGKRSVK